MTRITREMARIMREMARIMREMARIMREMTRIGQGRGRVRGNRSGGAVTAAHKNETERRRTIPYLSSFITHEKLPRLIRIKQSGL